MTIKEEKQYLALGDAVAKYGRTISKKRSSELQTALTQSREKWETEFDARLKKHSLLN